MDAQTITNIAAVLTVALSIYAAIANRPKVSADTSETLARARKIDAETESIIISQLREDVSMLRDDKKRCEGEIELMQGAIAELRSRIRLLENPPVPESKESNQDWGDEYERRD